jgi:hypothetical protein
VGRTISILRAWVGVRGCATTSARKGIERSRNWLTKQATKRHKLRAKVSEKGQRKNAGGACDRGWCTTAAGRVSAVVQMPSDTRGDAACGSRCAAVVFVCMGLTRFCQKRQGHFSFLCFTSFSNPTMLQCVSDPSEHTMTWPLSRPQVMRNPVCTVDGHTFEREAIEQWLISHDTSPLTGLRLPLLSFVCAHTSWPTNELHTSCSLLFSLAPTAALSVCLDMAR